MTGTDHAAAVFFRAVARDRHPTPGCTASQTLRGYEKCFSGCCRWSSSPSLLFQPHAARVAVIQLCMNGLQRFDLLPVLTRVRSRRDEALD